MPAASASPSALGTAVPVGRIDRFLKELWENTDTVCRASLVNLVLYNEREDSLEPNSAIVAALARHHACRALIVAAPPGLAKPELHSWVTAHCPLDAAGRKSVCCEQVTFLLRGFTPAQLASVVFAHLDSDLPLVFWWQGNLNDHFTAPLFRQIDRFVMDSAAWDQPADGFQRVLAAHQQHRKPFILHDLNWARSFYFRLALAACFDDPAASAELPRLEELVLRHGPRGRVTALLLLSWMACRAHWELEQAADGQLAFRTGPGGTRLLCRLVPAPHGPALQGLDLRSPSARFAVERSGRHYRPLSSLSAGAAGRLFPLDNEDQAALVSDVLGRGGNNALYLRLIRQLLPAL